MPSRTHALSLLLAIITLGASAPAAAYETWPAEDLQLHADVDAFARFASAQYQHTGDVFDLLDETSSGKVQTLGLALDAEFGLFPDVALFARTELESVQVKADVSTATVRGVSDFVLGGKWNFYRGAFAVTLAPSVKFPTGYTPDPGPYMPTLGNGVNEYTARLWAGKRFQDAPFYFEVGGGYRFRGTRVPRGGGPKLIYGDQIPYDLELGFDLNEQLSLLGLMHGVYGLGDPGAVDSVEFIAPVETYTRVGGGLGFRFRPEVLVQASYVTTVAGVNTLVTNQLAVSLVADLGAKQ
jgi:hypothetical protein